MSPSRRLLYLLLCLLLALTGALALARIGAPSVAGALAWAALVGTLAGGPGLLRRRAWPLALLLLPLGAYLVVRGQLTPPAHSHGLGAQLGFYLDRLWSGRDVYASSEFPLDFHDPSLVLLLSVIVYACAWLAGFFTLSLRRPLPALVVVLAMVGFGLTVDRTARTVGLPLAFLLLAGGLLALSHSFERHRRLRSDTLAGVATATIAGLAALSLLGVTSLASARPWQDWRSWRPVAVLGSGTHLSFDWTINYPRLLNPRKRIEVMRVTSPVPSYWRANALDYFTGKSWLNSDTEGIALERQAEHAYSVPETGVSPPGTTIDEVFDGKALFTDFFFTGGTPVLLRLSQPAQVRLTTAGSLGALDTLGPQVDYVLTARVPQLAPTDLIGLGREYPVDAVQYMQLPFPARADLGVHPADAWQAATDRGSARRQWLGLYRLDRTIVGDATDPYAITLRIEEYLREHYVYSLTLLPSDLSSPYAAFLLDTHVGYCQQFAGSMALLLRFNGIPARVAVGFATGRKVKPGQYLVTTNDAHAWVEVYFPQIGWVPFDPTPGHAMPGSGPSSTSAGFVDPFTRAGGAAAAAPSARATSPARHDPLGAYAGGRTTTTGPSRGAPWALGLIVVAAVLIAWPLVRLAVRQRRLRHGDAERRLRAALAQLHTDLRDFGVDVPAAQTLEETAAVLRARLGIDAGETVARAQAVLFGGRRAAEQDLDELARLHREVRRRLRASEGWARTALAQYGLRRTTLPAPT